MTRISITIPQSLEIELKTKSKEIGKSVSQLVREAISQKMTKEKSKKRKKSYWALDQMTGLVSTEENLSSSIDKLLYGDKGAWRSEDD